MSKLINKQLLQKETSEFNQHYKDINERLVKDSELEFIEIQIKNYNNKIKKQKQKITYIREVIEDEPIYEVQVLKKLYAKRYSLQCKKDKLLNAMK